MVQFKLIDEYDNGWKAVRGESNYYSQPPDGNKIKFGRSTNGNNRRRTRLYTALGVRFGVLPKHEHREAVPVRISAAGKAEIAAYLWAVHFDEYTPENQYYPYGISPVLDVSWETVTKYCSRVLRSVENKKVD